MGDLVIQNDRLLTFLTLVIAILSIYASLKIVDRLVESKRKERLIFVTLGSLTLGGGMWSMHFVAMLAADMNLLFTFDGVVISISIALSVISCSIAFYMISLGVQHSKTLLWVSSLIGTGFVFMHYLGMAAIQATGFIYNPMLIALSVGVAWLASFAALKLFLLYAKRVKGSPKIASRSIILGLVVTVLDYASMASVSTIRSKFSPSEQFVPLVGPASLGYLVVLGTLLIIGFTIVIIRYETKIEDSKHRLHIMDRMHRSIIESANDAVITADQRGKILSWNKAAETIFGYSYEEILKQPLQKIMPSGYHTAHQEGIERYRRTDVKKVIGQTVELEGLHKSGDVFPIELSLSTVKDGENVYFTGIIRDITERAESQKRIEELVYKDDLTHLPNRRMLQDSLTKYMEQAQYYSETIAVMFLDLDRFKQINDVYGHRIGDEVLKEVARRTQSCLSSKDFMARQSGDEFVVVLSQTSQYQAGSIAKDIIKTINEAYHFEGLELYTSASIGISLFPEDGMSAATLIKHADTAMYEAKKEGGSQYSYFVNEINEIISRKMMLETGLRRAIEREELEVYYQPQATVDTHKVIGFEALVRWNHPELGLVPPGDFISLAEETNLIVPMGEWILKEACHQFAQWIKENEELDHISVNISALQFRQPDFPTVVEKILRDAELDPMFLELELTESIVQEPERAFPIMHKLKNMGVKLSLDDFGTGYSSLSYLKDFPLDTLKIDKSFTQAIHESSKDKAVVETIVHMAKKLGLNVIAEGIETNEQLEIIIDTDCKEYQGYLCSPPLPSDVIQKKFIQKQVYL